MLLKSTGICAVVAALVCTPALIAQDTSNGSPQATFEKLKQLVENDQWDAVPGLMTNQAAEEFCANLVSESLAIAQMEMSLPIPGFSESQERLQEVIEKYGLDEIEIDSPAIEMKLDESEFTEDEEDTDAQAIEIVNANRKIIMDAIESQEKQWQIVRELWKARQTSLFGMSVLNGRFVDQEIDGEEAIIQVKLGSPDPIEGEEGGAQVVIAGPPLFAKFKREDETWKYNGMDMEKTLRAMREFIPKSLGSGGRKKKDF